MLQSLAPFGASLLATLVLDGLWLGVIASRFYSTELGTLARRSGDRLDPLWAAAIPVYVLIPLGVALFAVPRAQGDPLAGLGWGALFGVVLYGVYDLTNLSVLQGWSLRVTLADIVWGAILCGVATVAGTLASRVAA